MAWSTVPEPGRSLADFSATAITLSDNPLAAWNSEVEGLPDYALRNCADRLREALPLDVADRLTPEQLLDRVRTGVPADMLEVLDPEEIAGLPAFYEQGLNARVLNGPPPLEVTEIAAGLGAETARLIINPKPGLDIEHWASGN